MSTEFQENLKESFISWIEGEHLEGVICPEHGKPVKDCEVWCAGVAEQEMGLSFDMYAQDSNEWAWLRQFCPGLYITSAGGMLPFQAEGYLGDLLFYFRKEHGYASLSTYADRENMYDPAARLYYAEIDTDEVLDGKAWVSDLLTLVERLERAKGRYAFKSNNIKFEDRTAPFDMSVDMDPQPVWRQGSIGWGHTQEEAYADAIQRVQENAEYFMQEHTYAVTGDDGKPLYDENGKHVTEVSSWSQEKADYYVSLVDVQPTLVSNDSADRKFPDEDPTFEVKVPEVWRDEQDRIRLP